MTASLRPRFDSVALSNFRGFRSTANVRLAPLTFLVGPNSSGKSSLADGLLLLSQSRFAPAGTFVPKWSGSLVDLGSFSDVVYRHNSNLSVRLSVEVALALESLYRRPREKPDRLWPFRLVYRLRTSVGDPVGELVEVVIEDMTSGATLTMGPRKKRSIKARVRLGAFVLDTRLVKPDPDLQAQRYVNRQFGRHLSDLLAGARQTEKTDHHDGLERLVLFLEARDVATLWHGTNRVSSNRGGPQRWYSTGATAQELARHAGTPSLLDRVDPALVLSVDEDVDSDTPRPTSRTLQPLARILKRLDIADTIETSAISPYHTSIKARDNITRVPSNLMELGYGASQVIPVIKGCLSDSEGLLIVEQPEIHLHPKAQGLIADLLCETSMRRQVIVETHSVRFINRARIMVARGDLPPEHLVVNFVYRTKSGSHVKTIGVDERGEFTSEWPGGFFDERYEDTMELLRLRARSQG